MRCRGQVCENRRVLYGNLLLVVIAIGNPSLDRGAVERPGDEPPMKRVLVVVTLIADGIKPRDEIESAVVTEVRAWVRAPAR